MSIKQYLQDKTRLLFKAEEPNLNDYLGRFVTIRGEKILIKHIVGNRYQPKFLEINGHHLISMLRFFKQMNNDDSITEDQLRAFEEMDVSARKLSPMEKG